MSLPPFVKTGKTDVAYHCEQMRAGRYAMPGLVVRDRLVYPAAVVLALGAVTVAQPAATAASPRLAEIAAIRLQAEVTGFVSGLGVTATAGVTAPGPAASVAPAAATASAVGDTWPSTFLDKLIYNLPPQIQSIVIPPLYVVMTVVGAIMGLFYLVFGFPKDLMPAAAVAPETPRGAAAAAAPVEAVGAQTDSGETSGTPGADRAPVTPAADTQAEKGSTATRPTRGRHSAPAAGDGPTPAGAASPKSAAQETVRAARPAEATPMTVLPDASAVVVTAQQTPAATDASAPVTQSSRGRAKPSDTGSGDPEPARAATRSAR